jgi:hypothetical protein
MRLLHNLAKTVAILVLAVAVLGGAAALGGTIFEAPPRDAAEFEARVEAGSIHAAPIEKRTDAERAYALQLNDLCSRTDRARADVKRTVLGTVPLLRAGQRLLADFDEEFGELTPPRRYRAAAADVARLDRGMLDLVDGALAAHAAGDLDTYEAKLAARELLADRFQAAMVRLDAPGCATA